MPVLNGGIYTSVTPSLNVPRLERPGKASLGRFLQLLSVDDAVTVKRCWPFVQYHLLQFFCLPASASGKTILNVNLDVVRAWRDKKKVMLLYLHLVTSLYVACALGIHATGAWIRD